MGRQRCPTTSVMNSLHGNGMEFIHSGNFSIQSSFQCVLARSHYLQAFQQTFSSLSSLSFSLCPCFRRQIIAMTGQSQWWIPIFFVVTCFRPNKWRKSRHSNKYQRQSWNSFSLTESRLYWLKRTPKKTHRTVFIRNASVRFMSSNKVETNDFLFLLSHFFIVSICCSSSSNDNGRLHNKNRLTNWTAAIVIRVRFN